VKDLPLIHMHSAPEALSNMWILLPALQKDRNYQQHGKIIEWFGLEGTLKTTKFQCPCHGQGHLPLDQVAKSLIQPGLEHCQGWGIHSFSGQPVPVPHHPHNKEFISYIF